MNLKILGSGATHPIPKPCCDCNICVEARKDMSPPNMRTGPSLYIEDIDALIDTSQDISFQLNREDIKNVERIFYTHFHPDHTMGMMVINQIAGSYENKGTKVDIKMPEGVLDDLRGQNMSGMMDYYIAEGLVEVEEDFEKRKISTIEINAVSLAEPNTYGFSIREGKSVFYAPCDITGFDFEKVPDHDIFIVEFGGLEMSSFKNPDEITNFYRVLESLKSVNPDKVIFTHIEENRGKNHRELKKFAEELDVDFKVEIAYDGMRIKA